MNNRRLFVFSVLIFTWIGPAASFAQGERLSLDEAVSRAVDKNHQLQINRANFKIDKRNVSYGNAGFLPNVNATLSQSHMLGGSGFYGSGNIFTTTTAGLQLDWIMFAGMGRYATYDRLQKVKEVSRLQNRSAVESTIAEVISQFYAVVVEARRVEIYQQMVEASKQMLAVAMAKKESGTGSVIDANLARVELNEDRSNLEQSRQALDRVKSNLRQLMGVTDQTIRVRGDIEVASNLDRANLRQDMLDNNRQLRRLQKETEIADTEVEQRESNRWPEVSLGLGYNYQGFHDGYLPDFDTSPAFEYTVGVSVPIFRGFNTTRKIDNAQARLVRANIQQQQKRTELLNRFSAQWDRYNRQRERIDLAAESLGIAKKNFEIAKVQFKEGTINQVDLRQVQLSLLQSRIRFIEAKQSALEAQITLRRLSGRLYNSWF